ncbi:MAG: T9SS type A sorting domain-containing protein [Flavobacterium sp.]
MKKTLIFSIFICCNILIAQNANLKNTTSVCGNGILEEGEQCDGSPGCVDCVLIPAGTFFVEPGYGVKYITNVDGALKTANRSIKLNTDTNQFWLATNHQFNPYNFSYGGSSSVDADGANSNQVFIGSPQNTNLNKNYPLPIAGNNFVGNLLGEGINPKGVDIRSITNPSILNKRILPDDIGENDFDIFAATTQTDGKLLLAGRCVLSQGRMIVIRLNADYTFDTTFNGTGYAKFGFGSDCQARAIGLQSSGKIIVAGHQVAPGSAGIALRLNTNGTLDTSFGNNGSKMFNYEVETQNNYFLLSSLSEVYSLYITSSDNIYLCGTGSDPSLWNGKSIPTFHGLTPSGNDWLIMRDLNHLTASSLFNVDGSAYKITASPSGMVYLAGFSSVTNNKGLYLQRYDAVGNVDAGFNFKTGSQNGFYDLSANDDVIYDMALQNDGKILLAGESNSYGFYTRLMDTSLGIPLLDIEKNYATLAPNPVRNVLSLNFERNISEPIEILITDVSGKEVFRLSNPALNQHNVLTISSLEGLSNGIYILKILSGSKSQYLKFIKME